jgi:ATP-dependent RNA helicase RhlE
MAFDQFKLHPDVMKGVEAKGYLNPTPIQEEAIPPAMEGRDVMGLAQTGTGKTAAFMLPILHRLAEGARHHIRALIIAPTRELAEQTTEETRVLASGMDLRVAPIYGGVSFPPQLTALKTGVEILVVCPGRMLDHIGQGNVKLTHLEVLVLDEADRMLDMGFMPDIKRILTHVPKKRQTMMFSATMPEDIRHLAHQVLTDPVTVQIGMSMPTKNVEHYLVAVNKHLKTQLLRHVLKEDEVDTALIFTRTRHKATRLFQQLKRSGYAVASLQGDMSQKSRQAALDGFRSGEFKILVATDIASRGIDVVGISHVFNFDVPENVDTYIHRIGRTGRADRSGIAYTFVSPEESEVVMGFESSIDVELILKDIKGFDFDAPAPPMEERDYLRTRGSSRRPSGGGGGRSGTGRGNRTGERKEAPKAEAAPAPMDADGAPKKRRRRRRKSSSGSGESGGGSAE